MNPGLQRFAAVAASKALLLLLAQSCSASSSHLMPQKSCAPDCHDVHATVAMMVGIEAIFCLAVKILATAAAAAAAAAVTTATSKGACSVNRLDVKGNDATHK